MHRHIATHRLQNSAKRKHILLFQVDVVYSKITIIELKLWFNPVKAYSSLKKKLLKPLLSLSLDLPLASSQSTQTHKRFESESRRAFQKRTVHDNELKTEGSEFEQQEEERGKNQKKQ